METSAKIVLVVDDDDDLSSLVAVVLEDEGYQVEVAANGVEALDIVRRRLPDLILLDMKMPVMGGAEFAKEFHDRFDHGSPIVILTASADGSARANEVGAIDWVAKPFDLDDLVLAVERNLRR